MFRRWTLASTALIVSITSVAHSADDKHPVLNVWPGKVPGETKEIGKEGFREPTAVKSGPACSGWRM